MGSYDCETGVTREKPRGMLNVNKQSQDTKEGIKKLKNKQVNLGVKVVDWRDIDLIVEN